MTQADLVRIRVQLPTVFSTSGPVTEIDLLNGRLEQIQRVIGTVASVGQHALIYGERGVGKTSLASLIHQIWAKYILDSRPLIAARVQCDHDDDYGTIWRKVGEAIQRDIDKSGLTVAGNGAFEKTRAIIEAGDAAPTSVTSLFDLTGIKTIVVIDELDTVRDNETTRLMASTIKQLSDFAIDATLVLVGVADSVDELISEHESIDRCLNQVFLPRMPVDELRELVEKRLQRVGMGIEQRAVLRLAALSQGLPYYTHLLGLHAAASAVDSRSLTVTADDVEAALEAAISESQQSIVSDYTSAVRSPRPEALYRQTLLACALAPADELGYFAPADLRDPISAILGTRRDVASYMAQLNALARDDRGPALDVTGDLRSRRFRFANPLLKPYVILRGVRDKLITEQETYAFTEPDVAQQLSLDL